MNSSRRLFLKTAALAVAALPVLGKFATSTAFANKELPPAKEGEDPGKTLKYCATADKPNKNCEARKSKDKAKQYCYNCQLFTRLDGDKKAGKGKCMIMPKNTVTAAGWCMSWVQNPTVKD